MKKVYAIGIVLGGMLLVGCTGRVYNQPKNCSYDYLLHPAVSISKIIGGCGPIAKLPSQQ